MRPEIKCCSVLSAVRTPPLLVHRNLEKIMIYDVPGRTFFGLPLYVVSTPPWPPTRPPVNAVVRNTGPRRNDVVEAIENYSGKSFVSEHPTALEVWFHSCTTVKRYTRAINGNMIVLWAKQNGKPFFIFSMRQGEILSCARRRRSRRPDSRPVCP